MAEAAGLAVGVVGIAMSLKACIDLFDCFYAAWKQDRDYTILVVKLNIQKALLLQWAQDCGLMESLARDCSEDDDKFAAALPILDAIKELLTDAKKLQALYGVAKALPHERPAGGATPIAGTRSAELDRALSRLNLNASTPTAGTERSKQSSAISQSKLRWAFHDKGKFGILIADISYYVSGLRQLFPCTDDQAKQMFVEDMAPVKTTALGECVQEAAGHDTAGEETPQAAAAREHIAKLKRNQRILDRLWFRRIRDRCAMLSPPNSGTFEWLLMQDTSSSTWSDLPSWLQDNTKSLYWVCGKAGSGKSTVMKFLASHPKTLAFLKSWAPGCEMHIASFFFYHLGTEQQKSQQGLFQGLLHDILKAQPELIADLLPAMWREARVSEDTFPSPPLTLPSLAEMKHAFQQLAKPELQSHKYCLIIDGVDEFSGRAMDVVEFIQAFSSLPNVKVIVSSRPITSCVQAFSSCSQLNLEDLTQNDMIEYIDQRLGSHEYTSVLKKRKPDFMDTLQAELVRKASGVFLWLVVVCRALLEGFDNCDEPAFLEQRIDELPEELEMLFDHMFRKLRPTYRNYAFRMLGILRLQKTISAEPIKAMYLALADSNGLEFGQIAGVHPRDKDEDYGTCVILRERLRARCCGLIEIQGGPSVTATLLIRCQHIDLENARKENTPKMPCAKCRRMALKYREVDFIHRSLLEFMDTRNFALLQDEISRDGAHFEAALDLAFVFIHKLIVIQSPSAIEPRPIDFGPLLDCINRVTSRGVDQLVLLLNDMLGFLVDWEMDQSESDLSFGRVLPGGTTRGDLKLMLAAELRHQPLFERLWRDAGRPSLKTLSIGWPILYRALMAPLLGFVICNNRWGKEKSVRDLEFLRYLMYAECDPDEPMRTPGMLQDITTPWREILWYMDQQFRQQLEQGKLDEWLKVAELFLDSGASAQVARHALSYKKGLPNTRSSERAAWHRFSQLLEKCEASRGFEAAASAPPSSVESLHISGEIRKGGTKRKRSESSSCSKSRSSAKRAKRVVYLKRSAAMHTSTIK